MILLWIKGNKILEHGLIQVIFEGYKLYWISQALKFPHNKEYIFYPGVKLGRQDSISSGHREDLISSGHRVAWKKCGLWHHGIRSKSVKYQLTGRPSQPWQIIIGQIPGMGTSESVLEGDRDLDTTSSTVNSCSSEANRTPVDSRLLPAAHHICSGCRMPLPALASASAVRWTW